MRRTCVRGAVPAVLLVLLAHPASAQTFNALGTRAAGMGGAFVAVANDASGVYWNPAGLAAGAYFSVLLDRTQGEELAEGDRRGGNQSGLIVGLSVPAMGLSYIRLRGTTIRPAPEAPSGELAVTSLITHHVGATLVQSLTDNLAVGSTLKVVRGIATAGAGLHGSLDGLLDEAPDLVGRASTKVDADLGVMATFGFLRAGLTVRNVAGHEFETASDETAVELERQTRAGVMALLLPGWIVAADVDLERTRGLLGDVREVAIGSEGRIVPRLTLRAGVRFNTLTDEPGGRAPAASIGGSFAVRGPLYVDAHYTAGSSAGRDGWGIAARVAY